MYPPVFSPKRLRCAEHVQRFSAGLLDVLEGFATTLCATAGEDVYHRKTIGKWWFSMGFNGDLPSGND